MMSGKCWPKLPKWYDYSQCMTRYGIYSVLNEVVDFYLCDIDWNQCLQTALKGGGSFSNEVLAGFSTSDWNPLLQHLSSSELWCLRSTILYLSQKTNWQIDRPGTPAAFEHTYSAPGDRLGRHSNTAMSPRKQVFIRGYFISAKYVLKVVQLLRGLSSVAMLFWSYHTEYTTMR